MVNVDGLHENEKNKKKKPGVLLVLHQSENQLEIEICTETQVVLFDARDEEINRNVHRNSSRAVMMQLQK